MVKYLPIRSTDENARDHLSPLRCDVIKINTERGRNFTLGFVISFCDNGTSKRPIFTIPTELNPVLLKHIGQKVMSGVIRLFRIGGA